jgi:phosphoenolpyruvate-protein phosphotransferase
MTRVVLAGRTGSPGVGLGRLLNVQAGPNGLDSAGLRPEDSAGTGVARVDPDAERARLQVALDAAHAELEALARTISERAGDEIGAIFEAQALFARDPGIVAPAHRAIAAGARADEAILSATDEQAERLAAVDDEFFRARAADLRDVGRRVADLLRGSARPDLWHADGRPAVIVADDLDPSAVATLRPELVAGIALAGGTPTGHAAIVARGLGIPLVLGLGPAAVGLRGDTDGIVDGRDAREGRLIVQPDPDDLSAIATEAANVTPVAGPIFVPDSVQIAVTANIGSALEAEAAMRSGADGIGLVRTELLFLGRSRPPSVAEQRRTYTQIRVAVGDRPIVFRTLDVGGDKPAAWQADRPEANPALGVRGVRLGLSRPSLLDDQMQALVEAAAGRELRVMLPMVSTVGEVTAVRARLERLVAKATPAPSSVLLGVMIEVPAAALVADGFAKVADFFSIGTNDLVQYTLAADRLSPALADLATSLQPAVLRLIAGVVAAARTHGRHVAVCGEAAADPEMIPLLAGLGIEELSVAPASVAMVRSRAHGLQTAACRDLASAALLATDVGEVQSLLQRFVG